MLFVSALEAQDIALVPIATGLDRPVDITNAADGSGRLFITLQAGRIAIHDGSQVLPTPFLDIVPSVSCCGERGLLSVAFHPNYETNGFLYVYYTNNLGEAVIARYQVSEEDPNVANSLSETVLLVIPQEFANHNGGQLRFGPEAFLYVATGDGGSGGDPFDRAQDLQSLLGKILRIDVDDGSPYGIPPSNPFASVPGRDEIWAYGLRNPWRFSFDRLTGDILIGDVGQGLREEINFQHATSGGGENYGWRRMEGFACYNPPAGCNAGNLTLPILDYDHTVGCSVTGGYRYRGSRLPALQGTYFYADYCSGRLWGATEGNGNWTTQELLDTSYRISAFGEDEDGEIYLAHYANLSAGSIFRIDVMGTPTADSVSPASGSGTSAVFSYKVSDPNGYQDLLSPA